jgi:hypothetical protein
MNQACRIPIRSGSHPLLLTKGYWQWAQRRQSGWNAQFLRLLPEIEGSSVGLPETTSFEHIPDI